MKEVNKDFCPSCDIRAKYLALMNAVTVKSVEKEFSRVRKTEEKASSDWPQFHGQNRVFSSPVETQEEHRYTGDQAEWIIDHFDYVLLGEKKLPYFVCPCGFKAASNNEAIKHIETVHPEIVKEAIRKGWKND